MEKPIAIFDIECYPNYFLISFLNPNTGNTKDFELSEHHTFDIKVLTKVLHSFTLVSFNGIAYDMLLIQLVLTTYMNERRLVNNYELKRLSDHIINSGMKYWETRDVYNLKFLNDVDHIDLMEVAPQTGGLKLRGCRMHSKILQELPYEPDRELTKNEMENIKSYCHNDLQVTFELYEKLKEAIDLRIELSKEIGKDLRSKSDAQIGELYIASKVAQKKGIKYWDIKQPRDERVTYKYQPPSFLNFETELLQNAFKDACEAEYVINPHSKPIVPECFAKYCPKKGETPLVIDGIWLLIVIKPCN